ncbi:MAG TPA: methionine--tRNA ligase [Frankiaceae bacterium]|nr:methionine--tRNA ligase [Frankiaceae bacterium]
MFYVTTPIYYVNDVPHIGHAYTTVAGDVLTRWHRQRGEDVWFLTGTDEHGEKILTAAAEHGVTPQEWTDRMVETAWLPALKTIDAANDDFIRTTEARHEDRVRDFWVALREKGEVYSGTYTGPYCVACEEFKNPSEIVDGNCPIHGRPVKEISEENYFFPLSKYADRLLAHYEDNPTFVQPESARNEVLSFVKGGLQDISMSRSSFDWGIKVPWDDKHVIYVWIDALQNYLNATGWPEPGWEERWPADVHLVGKDILRFHAVIWPAMLMAAGLPLPKQVFANGWLLVGGEKMSKTKLTGIAPHVITDVFGSDAYRYYFLRAIPFGQDGSFSWEDMHARYKADLADQYGNLASRVTSMVERYREGLVPAEGGPVFVTAERVADIDAKVCALDFQGALGGIFDIVRDVNGLITERKPWELAKAGDDAALDEVLYAAADALRGLAVLLNAFMPKTSQTLWASLGAPGSLAAQRIADVATTRLPAGSKVAKSDPLFPRIEEPKD